MNEYNEALQNLLKVLDEKMLQIGTNLEKCQIILDNTVKLAREFVEKNKINFNESAPIINNNLAVDPHQPSEEDWHILDQDEERFNTQNEEGEEGGHVEDPETHKVREENL